MKQFFKMMFASTLGVMLAMGMIIAIGFCVVIGFVASVGSTPSYSPKAHTVLKIKLNGTLVENANTNPFASLMGDKEEVLSLKELREAIQTAKGNDNIVGIYLEAGSLATGSASFEALRRQLTDFKQSGKFVVAYGDSYSQGNYLLCSVADKVFLNPQGTLGLAGLASQTMFFKGLMDKAGVKMEIFKVGTYKGAVEPFMLDKLSDANREQIHSYISSIWGTICRGIANERKITVSEVEKFANEGLFMAEPGKAVEYGLVDSLAYKPDVEAYVKQLAGQSDKKLLTASVAQVNTLKNQTAKSGTPQVAVLYAEGEIKAQNPNSIYDMETSITEKLADELIKLKDDEDVKAVVLRVNSPGGSAYVSEQIWKQVVELKKVKPIVVSMSDVAASGGYYISCAANKIVAEANTLTGSIGIFGMFPNMAGLFDKLDVTTDIVKTCDYADLGDISRPMTDGERVLIQAYVERGYQLFLKRCADGRGMTVDEINAIGQGRVWTGEQAKERGLIDELGGIELAVSEAAKLSGLEENQYEVVSVSGSKNLLDQLLESQWGEIRQSVARNILGDQYEYFKVLEQAKQSTGIQARLPYDLKPL